MNANSAPAHPKAHHDRTTGRTKHSRVVPNASKHCESLRVQGGVLVCDFRVQSCRRRARAVVCLSWLLEYFHCSKWSQVNASIPQDRRAGARHCRRWLRLTLGDVPMVPLAAAPGVSSARFFPSSPRCTAALVDAPLRSVCRASPCCGKPHRTAPPTRPTALAALIDAARGVPRDNDVDMVQPPHTRHIRHPR